MALDHDREDALRSTADLCGDITRHIDLALVLLGAVRVAALHHQCSWKTGAFQRLAGVFHTLRVVVRLAATAQDQMTIAVAFGSHDRYVPVLVHGEEMVAALSRLDRIGGNADVA